MSVCKHMENSRIFGTYLFNENFKIIPMFKEKLTCESNLINLELPKQSNSYSFNVDIAILFKCSDTATVINDMIFWSINNKSDIKFIREGRVWFYTSIKAWNERYPYMTPNKIRGILDRLEEEKFVISNNFNKNKHDRTKWYSLSDKSIKLINYINNNKDFSFLREPKEGIVYVLKSNDLHKIGFTTNMDSRLKSHLTSNPTIQLVSQFSGTLKDEKELHAFFDNKRIGGEWFELSIEDLNYIKKYFNENFKSVEVCQY